MDHYEQIATHFQGSMECMAMAVDGVAEDLGQAADLLTATLLSVGKILVGGSGPDASTAGLLVAQLMAPLVRERPALPALRLGSPFHENGASDTGAANQVRALGQQGDSLVVVISDEGTAMQAVLSAARERNMAVIAVSNVQTSALADTSYAMEAWVQPEAANRQHLVELHTGLVNCLVTLGENNLFGTEF